MISILSGRFEISWYWLGIRDSKDAQSVHRTQLNAFFTFIYEVVVRQKNIWLVQTSTYVNLVNNGNPWHGLEPKGCCTGCRLSTETFGVNMLHFAHLLLIWCSTAYSYLELLIAPHVMESFSFASTAWNMSPSFTSATVLAKSWASFSPPVPKATQ